MWLLASIDPETLSQYGGWGVSAILVGTVVVLYAEVRTLHRARIREARERLDEAKGHLRDQHAEALATAKALEAFGGHLAALRSMMEAQRRSTA